MDKVQAIINKIDRHDKFNLALERQLTRIKVAAVFTTLALWLVFINILHPPGIFYAVLLLPLLSILAAARYLRRRTVMSGHEIRQCLQECLNDKDFAQNFIPLLLNVSYVTQVEIELLTQHFTDSQQREREAYQERMINKAIQPFCTGHRNNTPAD